MSTIHGVEVHFRSGAEEAKKWLEYGLTREGFKKLSDGAKGAKIKFNDDQGHRFDLEYDKEKDSFSVKPHY